MEVIQEKVPRKGKSKYNSKASSVSKSKGQSGKKIKNNTVSPTHDMAEFNMTGGDNNI